MADPFVVPDSEAASYTEEDLQDFKELFFSNPYSQVIADFDKIHYNLRQESRRPNKKKKTQADNGDGTDGEVDPRPDEIETKEMLKTWVEAVQEQLPCCFFYRRGTLIAECDCLREIKSDDLVNIQFFMASQEKGMRQTFYKQFISCSKKKRNVIINLPCIPSEVRPLKMCVHSFRNLFAIRDKQYVKIRKEIKSGNPGPSNNLFLNNQNRQKASLYKQCKDDVVAWLNKFAGEHGEPSATRFICEATGIGIRDAEVELRHLPSHMTKRGIYTGYVHEHGYQLLKPSHKGSYRPISSYKLRKDDPHDTDWPDSQDPDPVCSLSIFWKIWKEHCPFIVICPRSEDICGECYVLQNSFRYGVSKNKQDDDSEDDPLSGDEEEMEEEDTAEAHDGNANTDLPLGIAQDEEAWKGMESLVERAADHVRAAQAMRRAIKEREMESQQLYDSNVEHESMSYTVVIDYAQNLDVPHFGGQQPGETYYYSPKSVYVFGVCDMWLRPTQLYAYCYEEETGKKGGNNVASLLMLHLHSRGLLPVNEDSTPRKGKKLTVACDNCGGQNKNNMVIRMANYLVEKGHFEEVEFLFFIKGHTKNACDRCFNLMKIRFHNQNVYTFDAEKDDKSLMRIVSSCQDFHPVKVTEDNFRDWDTSLLNRLYTRFKDGVVSTNHSFNVSNRNGATTVQVKLDEDEVILAVPHDLKKKRGKGVLSDEERKKFVKEAVPDPLKAPGLNKLKQVDLFKKWRPLIPPEFQDVTCPKPPEDVMQEVCQERRKKAKDRRQKKKG